MARTCILRAFGCRCRDVFLWCYACFVLLRFRLYAFIEAAALRFIVLRYAGALLATRVSFFFHFLYLEMSLFPSIFCTIAVFSLHGEYVVRSFLLDAFFYLVTTGWVFTSTYVKIQSNQSNQKYYLGFDSVYYTLDKIILLNKGESKQI